MRLTTLFFSLALLLLLAFYSPKNEMLSLDRDRSPHDLALTPDGKYALTANATSNSASLVDIAAGGVVQEITLGDRPFAVAIAAQAPRAIISNYNSNTLSVLKIESGQMRVEATIEVGAEPRGVALCKDGSKAFVSLAGEDAVAVVDIAKRKVTATIEVGTEPWYLALTPDEKRLAVGNTRSQDVSVIEVATQKVLHTTKLRGRNVRQIAIDPQGKWAYVNNVSEQGRPTTPENIDRGWVIANRLSRIDMTQDEPREAIALDTEGNALADIEGTAISPDGKTVLLTAGGSHEVTRLRLPLPFMSYGGPPDHINGTLQNNPAKFARLLLGERPVSVRFTADGRRAIIADYLQNAIHVLDVERMERVKTIALGSAKTPSLARQGERLFLDGTRSFKQWYSCNSCHVEGHTNGGTFDTSNDGSYQTTKKTLSLRGATKTAPYTWHGWQKDLKTLIHDSFRKSMQGPEPTAEELNAVYAYLETLDWRPNPRAKDPQTAKARMRGEALFKAKACDTCHAPPYYTSSNVYTVGLESTEDAYKGYNPPTLLNVGTRSPYLHDGRSRTLRDVLKNHHRPSKLTGKTDFTDSELTEIVLFLKAL